MEISARFQFLVPVVRRDDGAPTRAGLPVAGDRPVAADKVSLPAEFTPTREPISAVNKQLVDLTQAVRQAQAGAALSRAASSVSGDIEGLVRRIRDLSVEAAQPAEMPVDHAEVAREIRQLREDIDTIARQSRFNGISLAGPDAVEQAFDVGGDEPETLVVPLANLQTRAGAFDALGRAIENYPSADIEDAESQRAAAAHVAAQAAAAADWLVQQREQLAHVEELFDGHLAVGQIAADNLHAAGAGWDEASVAVSKADDLRSRLLGSPDIGVASHAPPPNSWAARLLEV